jgi:hypothetical protein
MPEPDSHQGKTVQVLYGPGMINYYQPRLRPFLKLVPNKFPQSLDWRYYHSFEDGLWDIIQNKFPHRCITVLVPDFYCSDVLDNIRRHGHKYIYYQVDKNYQISPARFARYLWTYEPEIIIIFDACGIKNKLFYDRSWIKEVKKEALIIEDCVHRLVNPEEIKLIDKRHILLDSLRKVSPLPGSRMIGTKPGLSFLPEKKFNFSGYFLKTLYYYVLFRAVLRAGFWLNDNKMVTWAHRNLLKKHDDVIGDRYIPQAGWSGFKPLIARIDYEKIQKIKIAQIRSYKKILAGLFKLNKFFEIKISPGDEKEMHVYPLGTTINVSMNIPVWPKFEDVPWSRDKKVLFLPLGFHIGDKDILYIKKRLNEQSEND